MNANNWIVIVFDQYKTSEKNRIHTFIENRTISNNMIPLSKYIMSLWIEKIKSKQCFIYGVGLVNIHNGETFIFECHTTQFAQWNQYTTYDEIERIISTFQPSEMI